MNLSDVIFEPTERDLDYVEAWFTESGHSNKNSVANLFEPQSK